MPIPGSEPGLSTGSDDPQSFAVRGWRLATQDGCRVCERQGSPGSAECAACRAALESLMQAERLHRRAYLADQVNAWRNAGLLSTSAARRVWQALEQPEPARPQPVPKAWDMPSVAVVAAPVAGAPPTEAPPVQAAGRPSFSWRQLGESLLAERTLNTLLGLGAFLILAAALVISVFNPTRLALAPHVGVLTATMTLFYAAGYVCYARLRLTRGGETLLVIAAAFVPLEVWTVGGSDGLGWSLVQTWAASSAVALAVCAISYALLPGRAFGALLAIAANSLPLSLLAVIGISADWILCAGVTLGLGFTLGASRLRAARWTNLDRALLGVAHVATPVILLILLSAKYLNVDPGSGEDAVSDYAVGGAWWLGVGLYAATAYLYRRAPFEAIAVWLAPVAYLLTLTKTPWEPAWYGVWFVGLGGLYALYGRRSGQAGLRHPATLAALVLTIGGLVWAGVGGVSWAMFAAVLADSLLCAVAAAALRSARTGLAAVGLLAGGFGLALELVQWPNWSPDKPWPWLILALLLGIGAEVQMQASGEARRPLPDLFLGRGGWRAMFAPACFDVSVIAGGLALALAPFGGLKVASTVFAMVGLGLAAAGWTRRAGIFLYPSSMLIALAVLLAGLAFSPNRLPTGAALAVLGCMYGLIGWRLGVRPKTRQPNRSTVELRSIDWPRGAATGMAVQFSAAPLGQLSGASYVWPLWATGLLLSVAGPALAVFDGGPLQQTVVAATCAIGYAAVLATIRTPVWAYPVAIWLVATYELALNALVPEARPSLFLGALVLPTCVALAIAAVVTRRAVAAPVKDAFAVFQFARVPWALPPSIVAVCGFAASLTTTIVDSAVAAVVLAVYSIVLGVVAMRSGDRSGERWVCLSLLLGSGMEALDWARPGGLWVPPSLVGFGVALAVLSLLADRTRRLEIRAWRVPLEWLAIGSAGVGELLALSSSGFGGSAYTAALCTALCAVVELTFAYGRRSRLLAYAGVATLILAALIELAASDIGQPQAYALPVGMYLMGLAWLESPRRQQSSLKALFESAALLVLLGTTALQGVGSFGDGLSRYPYDVALILEGLAVLGVGAGLHWWRSLSAGAAAVVLAVLILLSEPLATVNTWYLIGSLGLLLMTGVVFLERRRQQIPMWVDGWRERLETWG